ncbi:MAG: DNA adenine methylase [Dehalococcoidia bacterium]
MARPFLKWAGGKAKLAPRIVAAMPPSVSGYVEPFAGAAAVFFSVENERPKVRATLNDANAEIIETFTVLRDERDALLDGLAALSASYHALEAAGRRDLFYSVRASSPHTPAGRAARFIFLNKTCYNGLFRVNAGGGFNVPHGRYKSPRILDGELLTACSAALQHAELRSEDFAATCAAASPGDFVYLDPPYHPLSSTANFTGYTRADFGRADQQRLRDAFEDLSRRGVAAMLSNSDHEYVRGLYGGLGYRIQTVTMSRAINSRGTGRQPIGELLIDNFERVGLRSSES